MSGERGYQVEPDLLEQRITTLTTLADLTGDLVATASRLAERLPMLGTAPPAVDLATRLREAAGRNGLAGEVRAAEREVQAFRRTLSDAKVAYVDQESDAESAMRSAADHDAPHRHTGGSAGHGRRATEPAPDEALS